MWPIAAPLGAFSLIYPRLVCEKASRLVFAPMAHFPYAVYVLHYSQRVEIRRQRETHFRETHCYRRNSEAVFSHVLRVGSAQTGAGWGGSSGSRGRFRGGEPTGYEA